MAVRGGGNWFRRPFHRDPLLWFSLLAGTVSGIAVACFDDEQVSASLHAGWYGTAIAAVVLVSGRALWRGLREPRAEPLGPNQMDSAADD